VRGPAWLRRKNMRTRVMECECRTRARARAVGRNAARTLAALFWRRTADARGPTSGGGKRNTVRGDGHQAGRSGGRRWRARTHAHAQEPEAWHVCCRFYVWTVAVACGMGKAQRGGVSASARAGLGLVGAKAAAAAAARRCRGLWAGAGATGVHGKVAGSRMAERLR
jgi:hypothetical protein